MQQYDTVKCDNSQMQNQNNRLKISLFCVYYTELNHSSMIGSQNGPLTTQFYLFLMSYNVVSDDQCFVAG